jgi:hypothetical protein
VIKWEKQCKYAKDRIVSLKTVPPKMWKAQYSGDPAGISKQTLLLYSSTDLLHKTTETNLWLEDQHLHHA